MKIKAHQNQDITKLSIDQGGSRSQKPRRSLNVSNQSANICLKSREHVNTIPFFFL